MTAAALLAECRRAGVALSLDGAGGLAFRGNRQAVNRLLPTLKANKAALLGLLVAQQGEEHRPATGTRRAKSPKSPIFPKTSKNLARSLFPLFPKSPQTTIETPTGADISGDTAQAIDAFAKLHGYTDVQLGNALAHARQHPEECAEWARRWLAWRDALPLNVLALANALAAEIGTTAGFALRLLDAGDIAAIEANAEGMEAAWRCAIALAVQRGGAPRPAPAQTEPPRRVLCANCIDNLTGTDPCGSWWGGQPHTCASYRPANQPTRTQFHE